MRRLAIFLSLTVIGLLVATASAFMQDGSKSRFGVDANQQKKLDPPVEFPRTQLNGNRLHKLIVTDKDLATYNEFAKAKAIRSEIDYGSYKLIVVDEEAVGGRAALEAMQISPRDDQNMMMLNGYLIDTSDPQPLSKSAPAALQQASMSAALNAAVSPAEGFYIIQFAGPVQDGWLKSLEKTGAKIITYVPNNGYVVSADQRAAAELVKLKENNSFVQWLGDFHPAYKLATSLQAMIERGDTQPVRVTVQLIEGAEGRLKAEELKKSALQVFGERRVLKYRNVTVLMPISLLSELARSKEVLAIEEDRQPKPADEIQGQIVAGNLTGNAPSGSGYLDWLASKGFNSSQFGSFSVNVADDSYSLRGHPDLPDSRIAFENNPTNMTGPQHGHGFLNSHIIGGFNNATGPAFEDANGFNYNMGIAPWTRLGVTAIFGPGPTINPSAWEETAYGQSARISSNSWLLDFTWYYDTFAQEYDSLVRDAQSGTPGNQQLAVIFCAGNDGIYGNGTVTSPGTAKNVVTVGASENVRPTETDGCFVGGLDADNANDMAYFSSRGPVSDGRIKPDIVAPGTHIQGGIPQSDYDGMNVCNRYFPAGQTLYSWSSGTSHSTPAVAGGAALIYQDYLNKGLTPPSPAMIKALLMNSASYLTGTGANDTLPSKSQGMGLMNLGRTFDGASRLLTDQTQLLHSSGETYRIAGTVAATDQPVRITLAWTDAPGTPISAPWVNDLDLEVNLNGQTYRGNVFSGSNSTTGGTSDGKNNVESVFLPAGVSGDFLVTVRATNIAGDGVPGDDDPTDQDFALVVYNANAATLNSPVIDVSPASLKFTAVGGSGNPANQVFNISNAGAGTLNWTAGDDAPWLTLNLTSGAAPSMITASVDINGLAAGTYNAIITIQSPGAFNSPLLVPVTLTVSNVFTANPASLFFSTYDGTNPASQTIQIVNNDSIPRDWTLSDDTSWLSVSPTSGTSSSTLTVSVNIRDLPGGNPFDGGGSYRGTITIRPTHAPNVVSTIPVQLYVSAPLYARPSRLSFAATFGAPNPASQLVEIFNVYNGTPLNWTATVSAPWLKLSSTTGTTPSQIGVSVDIRNLPIGTYNGSFTLRGMNPPGSPEMLTPTIVPVTLTVNQITNAGFEGLPDPWVLSGLAMDSAGANPHGGTGYLLMGGSNRSGGTAYQQVVVPSGNAPNFSFWLNVTSDENTTTERNDVLYVEVRDLRGRLLKTLAMFSNLNKSASGSYAFAGNYDLRSFTGQTVRIQFRTTTNPSLLTSFRIDDITLTNR